MQSDSRIDDYVFHCVCRDSLCKSFISIEEDGSMTFTTPIFFKLDEEHFKRFDSINPWTYIKRLLFLIRNKKLIPFVYDAIFTEEDAIKLIVNGFCQEVFRKLPMEFALEAEKLLDLKVEKSLT